jgi:hypothetical protein
MKNRILIVVEGGLIQNIFTDKDVAVEVVDWDNLKEGGAIDYEIDFGYPITIGSKSLDKAVMEAKKDLKEEKKAQEEAEIVAGNAGQD